MSRSKFVVTAILLCAVLFSGTPILRASTISYRTQRVVRHRPVKHNHERRKKLVRQGGWAAAGVAAGQAAGPAGSAAVGAAKYRRDLKAGGHRRTRAIAKIGAPIAAGAVAGPAGSAGVEVVEHRKWIKRHIFHLNPRRSRQSHGD